LEIITLYKGNRQSPSWSLNAFSGEIQSQKPTEDHSSIQIFYYTHTIKYNPHTPTILAIFHGSSQTQTEIPFNNKKKLHAIHPINPNQSIKTQGVPFLYDLNQPIASHRIAL